ncbi:MAG: hypothetical protein ACC634_00705 [Hyphomicrobiales bacterium]
MTKKASHAAAVPKGDTPDGAPPARGLKLTVLIMGVLLVLGFVVVFATIVYRVVASGDEAKSPASARGAFGAVEVAVPAGAQVVATDLRGDRALVRLRVGEGVAGREELLVLDIKRGIVLGRFRLNFSN